MFGFGKLQPLVDQIESLKKEAEIYRERNKQLEYELSLSQDLRLKYQITKMLIDDDPMIDEMIFYANAILNRKD